MVARTVRNQKLDTRSARAKLPAKKSPHWVSLAPGCALGYRKGPKGAVWLAKIVRDGMRRETTLGTADDVLDPDGVLAIGYPQAQAKAREWFEAVVRPATQADPYTVREAVADYLDWFRATGRKSIKETEASVNAFILPRLGDEEVPTLTAARLRKWLAEIAASPPRLRTRPGQKQNVRDTSDDPEASRRRCATANRILTVLKAALTMPGARGKRPLMRHGAGLYPFVRPIPPVSAISTATSAADSSMPARSHCAGSYVAHCSRAPVTANSRA
jgi:hypothetical protein